MDTILQNTIERKYGRDFLLQLRLHPFSLQRPSNLKDHVIVKDKLYLHHIDNTLGSRSSNFSYSSSYPDYCHLPLKQDPEIAFRYHHPVPDCCSRNCSLYASGRKCNAMMPSKSLLPYIPDYVGSTRKLQFPTSDCKFNFSCDDVYCPKVPWWNQCCSFPDELWNSGSQSDHESSSKTSLEGLSKSKKKPLPIIDPKNGKNIFDDICQTPTASQESIISAETYQDSETTGLKAEISGLSIPNKEFKDIETSNCEKEVITQDVLDVDFSSQPQPDNVGQNLVLGDIEPKEIFDETLKILSQSADHAPKLDSSINLKEISEEAVPDSAVANDISNLEYDLYKKFNCIRYAEPKFMMTDCLESDKQKTSKDTSEFHQYQMQSSTEKGEILPTLEWGLKFDDQLKRNLKFLKEKIYSIKQQQQKMEILQSFLHFKKHQLDESYQNMEDKKIEIANWEYNLAHKAKRLQDKECWLEARRLNLKNKELKLNEKEKMLGEGENICKSEQYDELHVEADKALEANFNDSKEKCSINYELGDSFDVKEFKKHEVHMVQNSESAILYQNGVIENSVECSITNESVCKGEDCFTTLTKK